MLAAALAGGHLLLERRRMARPICHRQAEDEVQQDQRVGREEHEIQLADQSDVSGAHDLSNPGVDELDDAGAVGLQDL